MLLGTGAPYVTICHMPEEIHRAITFPPSFTPQCHNKKLRATHATQCNSHNLCISCNKPTNTCNFCISYTLCNSNNSHNSCQGKPMSLSNFVFTDSKCLAVIENICREFLSIINTALQCIVCVYLDGAFCRSCCSNMIKAFFLLGNSLPGSV